jgi:hypothetical protein
MTEIKMKKGTTEDSPKFRASGTVTPRPINKKGEYVSSNETLDATTYSIGDTGSQFTASLEARLLVCPSSNSIPAKITAEVRMTGSTMRD